MATSLTASELFDKLKRRENLYLLDIRNSSQYKRRHFFLSKNIPFHSLADHIDGLPKDKEIIIISDKDDIAIKATNELLKNGFNVRHLDGGIKAWNTVYDIVPVEPIRISNCQVFQVKRLGKGCLSYIVVNNRKGTAVIIDPSRHIEVYLNFLKNKNLDLLATLDTHIHEDHISGGKILAERFNIPYLLPKQSRVNFSAYPLEDMISGLITDEKVMVVSTPGHTKESVVIYLGKAFTFTGDTLLLEHTGQVAPDGEIRKNAELLYTNIIEKLFTLDDNIFVLPGHTQQSLVPGGAMVAASLRYIKRANGINKIKSAKKFVKFILEKKPKYHPHALRIKEVNINGGNVDEDFDELEMTVDVCALTS